MGTLVIELDDRALAVASGGRVIASAPSAIFDGSGAERRGEPAWHALRLQPTATSTRHLGEVAAQPAPSPRALALLAAELRRCLESADAAADARIWVAASARFGTRGLGAVLGILRDLSRPVDGFVDAATVSVAALGLDRTALVLELGLHHVAVTAVESAGQASRRRALVSDAGGLIELFEAWLDLVSTAMVRRTRFDPLHDAATEQQLFDALPALAREAAATGAVTAGVTSGTERFETSLTRDQFVQAGQSVYREIVRLLHALRPAGAPVAVVVPQAALDLPGLRPALDQFHDCELVMVTDGFAAAATSLLDLPVSEGGEAVRLLRRLPSRLEPALAGLATRDLLGRAGERAPQASHVLFEGRAFALGREPLVVGRAPGDAHGIALPDGLAGVSRRHCTFVRDGGEIVLVDHSTFGTFVNGERVAERVRVHAGDRVRVGEPGVELSLIAVGEPAGSHATAQAQG